MIARVMASYLLTMSLASAVENTNIYTVEIGGGVIVTAQAGNMEPEDHGSYILALYKTNDINPPYRNFQYGIVQVRNGRILLLDELSTESGQCVLLISQSQDGEALAQVFISKNNSLALLREIPVKAPENREELDSIKHEIIKSIDSEK